MTISKHILIVFTLIYTMLAPPLWAETDAKIALVIGNSAYEGGARLKNPENDAHAMANKLNSLGFTVIEGYNLDFDAMRDTVRDFAKQSRSADMSIIYYAGHGISDEAGRSYLVPVGASLTHEDDIEFETMPVDDIIAYAKRANNASLIFLDACRNFPDLPSASRSAATRSIARIPNTSEGTTIGTVIAYSTEPGNVALDGEGANSPFTTALLAHLGTANTDFAALTSRITRDVLDATNEAQRPRFDVSLNGPLILHEVAATPTGTEQNIATPAQDNSQTFASLEVQKYLFEIAKESGDAADYQAYLDQFPTGMFANNARNAMLRLEESAEPVQQVPPPPMTTASLPQVRMASAPLQLQVTDAVRVSLASQQTEQGLGMSRTKRKEVQLRLNLSGNNVGTPDGAFGPKTRKGISNWQIQNGLMSTGYLNMVQMDLLTARTEPQFRSHMAANPNALSAAPRKTYSSKKKNSAVGAGVAGFAAGVVTGLIIGK